MDKYRIDSHKLIYHIPRVNDWLSGKMVYPIYTEIATSGTCNHRCTYCALDYMEYQHRFLDTKILKERLSEMARLGVRSVMYAGEGEPFLHKDIEDIVLHTKNAGIDVAFTSNGVVFIPKLMRQILHTITWIKVSINGATKETYAKVHRCSPDNFERVIHNIGEAVKFKRENNLECAIGMQMILLPENRHEAALLAEKARGLGADYLVVKPYSHHSFSHTQLYKDFHYREHIALGETLRRFNTKDFQVIFREHTMRKWDSGKRNYERCLALPFWSYIDAGGNVCGCSAYLGDERFMYGNIYHNSFQEIWEGEQRKKSMQWVGSDLDTSQCRVNCRMDEINRYLWELKHPSGHVNFI